MKKKVLSLCLVIALVAIAAVSGMLAYFTDTDVNYNTMVFGSVEIDQFEKEIVYDAETGEPIGMQDYVNDKGIMPAAGAPAYEGVFGQWSDLDAANTGAYAGEEFFGGNELWADHMNAQDKVVFVKNTGNNDVYYRTIILLEDPSVEGTDIPYAELRPNVNNNEKFDWDPTKDGVQNGNNTHEFTYVTVDGVRYLAIVATYVPTLAPDEISRPSFLQVAVDESCTQEYAALFGDKLDIYCFTQAVQAEGFDDAHSALNAAFGECTVENIQSWIDSDALVLA